MLLYPLKSLISLELTLEGSQTGMNSTPLSTALSNLPQIQHLSLDLERSKMDHVSAEKIANSLKELNLLTSLSLSFLMNTI